VVEADASGTAGQVEPPSRLDPVAHGEHEQRVAARVGDVAPRRRCAAVQAGEVRRADAGRGVAEEPAARVAQLEHARAAEEDDAASTGQRRDLACGAYGRRQLADTRRAAAGEHEQRADPGANRTSPA
jgi:hypothetical protein